MFYGSNCDRKSKLSGLLTEPLNPREQRNGPIIHDVTSNKYNKYNKENEIFSHQLTCFPRLNKSVLKQKIKNTKFQAFYRKIRTLFQNNQ